MKIQTHADWLSARLRGIGASEASAVIGCNPYMDNVDLWKRKTRREAAPDISDKPCVQYGHAAEEFLRGLFALDYPEYQVEHHEFRVLQSLSHPFMQASLDGELTDQEGRRGILEIKTTNILQSSQWEKWKNDIPDNYFWQVLHYLAVTEWDFAVLRAQIKSQGNGRMNIQIRDYPIERKDMESDIRYLIDAERNLWECVQSGQRPNLILPAI